MGRIGDSFITYKIIRQLSKPWDEWDAFEHGIINKKGELIKEPKTPDEKDSYTMFDKLVRNLKKVIEKIPGGKSRLGSMAATLWLVREEYSSEVVDQLIKELDLEFYTLEDSINEGLPHGFFHNVTDEYLFVPEEDNIAIDTFMGLCVYKVRNPITSKSEYITSYNITR